jgi:hypothetical protein
MALSLSELRAKLAAQKAAVLEAVEAPAAMIPVSAEPVVTAQPEPIKEHEPHVITEDSPVITELKDNERPDSDFIIIGGQAIAKDNPIFAKLNIVWENDAEATTATVERLTQDERIQMLEPTELAQLLLNRELSSEFGISNLTMYREVFNNEVVKVKDMSLGDIEARITKHHRIIEQINILIQADVTVKIEKSKRERKEATAKGDADYNTHKTNVFKKRLASRPVRKAGLSEDEKLIQNLMKNLNISREKAEAFMKDSD